MSYAQILRSFAPLCVSYRAIAVFVITTETGSGALPITLLRAESSSTLEPRIWGTDYGEICQDKNDIDWPDRSAERIKNPFGQLTFAWHRTEACAGTGRETHF